MTGAMARTVVYLIMRVVIIAVAQYTDDSDYNDFEFYEDLPTPYERNTNEYYQPPGHDDFYIVPELEDTDIKGSSNSAMEDTSTVFEKNVIPEKTFPVSSNHRRDWYKRPERIYRYTKHRIPGYDYDELDFMAGRASQQCDQKSLWTNCVCQFTCYDPNIVDCFTPCRSGCECKEDYVFDEKTQQCILPEQCSGLQDYLVYKK